MSAECVLDAYKRIFSLACSLFRGRCALLSGCQVLGLRPEQPGSPTEEHQVFYTQAAQTIEARLTLSAGETAVAQLTTIVRQATTGLPALDDTPGPTRTPRRSPTPGGHSATSTMGVETLSCLLTSTGACAPNYPAFQSVGLLAGWELSQGARGAAAGFGCG